MTSNLRILSRSIYAYVCVYTYGYIHVCVCVCVRCSVSVRVPRAFLIRNTRHFQCSCVLCMICNMKTCHSEIQLQFLCKRYILLNLHVYTAAEVRISYYQFPYLAAISVSIVGYYFLPAISLNTLAP